MGGCTRWARQDPVRAIGPSVAERVGFEPTKSFDSTLFKSAAFNRSATSPRARIARSARHRGQRSSGAGVGVGIVWLSRPFRSKIVALPDGTSITWILSVSFWMYWYWRIWSDSEAARDLLAVACPLRQGDRRGRLTLGQLDVRIGLTLRLRDGLIGLDLLLGEDLLLRLDLLLGDLLCLDGGLELTLNAMFAM